MRRSTHIYNLPSFNLVPLLFTSIKCGNICCTSSKSSVSIVKSIQQFNLIFTAKKTDKCTWLKWTTFGVDWPQLREPMLYLLFCDTEPIMVNLPAAEVAACCAFSRLASCSLFCSCFSAECRQVHWWFSKPWALTLLPQIEHTVSLVPEKDNPALCTWNSFSYAIHRFLIWHVRLSHGTTSAPLSWRYNLTHQNPVGFPIFGIPSWVLIFNHCVNTWMLTLLFHHQCHCLPMDPIIFLLPSTSWCSHSPHIFPMVLPLHHAPSFFNVVCQHCDVDTLLQIPLGPTISPALFLMPLTDTTPM